MTDFGTRDVAAGATESKQDDVITALAALHTAIATTLVAYLDSVEPLLGALEDDVELLTAQTTHTFVDDITFDDDPTTYTADGFDVSAYREFLLILDLAVANAPTDIVIRVEFSDDNSTYYRYINEPFGDLRFEDTAGAKKEALRGKCIAPFMRVYVAATGTDGTDKFILTVKGVLTR